MRAAVLSRGSSRTSHRCFGSISANTSFKTYNRVFTLITQHQMQGVTSVHNKKLAVPEGDLTAFLNGS